MNPLLNEAERALRDAAREVATQVVAPAADALERQGRLPEEIVERLRGAGWTREGELGLLGAALIVEEIARASAAVGTWLARVSAVAPWSEPARAETTAIVLDARLETSEAGRLDGRAGPAVGAAAATHLLVARRGGGLLEFAVDGSTVTTEPVTALGLRGAGLGRVAFRGAEGVAVGDEAARVRLLARWRVLQAARSVGVAQAALEVALQEVRRRREAGDPLDRSQAVQWMLADGATEIEGARLATWSAATAEEGERDEAAAACRVMAAEAAVAAARRALEIAGAEGAVAGSPAERLYRDAKMLEIDGETNEDALRDLADLLLPDLAGA